MSQRNDVTVDVLLEQLRRSNERAASFERMFARSVKELSVVRRQRDAAVADNKRLRNRLVDDGIFTRIVKVVIP